MHVQLTSIDLLAGDLGPWHRAIKVLAYEGLVVTKPGRGTFVVEQA
jgi:hypothetical protein